ncbi:hypothetical protein BJ170DRAFT_161852 [Xylariales sp. AK1849]|nr:hypothetical protein BJ170DRAFT_161852 [Xylariales sp. AK1849]
MAQKHSRGDLLLPHNPPTFSDTPASLLDGMREVKDGFFHVLNTIVLDVDPENASFENTLAPMALAESQLSTCGQRAGLLESASGDENIRIAAGKVHIEVQKIYESWFARRDVFERVRIVHRQMHNSDLDNQSKKLTEKWYQCFLNEGCQLGPKDRETLHKINEHIGSNRSDFRRVLNETKDSIWLTRGELSGLSSSIVDSLEEVESNTATPNLTLSLKSSMVKTALAQIHDERVRKAIFEASEKSVAAALTPFAEALKGRHQKAKLLGNKSWAERSLSQKMARDPEVVRAFLASLREKLTLLAQKELRHLQELKRAQLATSSTQEKAQDGYYLWDQPYYHQQHLTQSHQLDSHTLSEYFPAEHVLRSMLEIYEDVFSISFHEVDETTGAALTDDPSTLIWHSDVKMFLVWERGARNEDDFVGYLYVDLYARDGKYSTCANFSIHPGFTDVLGKRHPCATALLTNIPRPAPKKPSLLQHSNVVQMFHELGHGMHDLLSRTEYVSLHGHEVPWDFIEMPSQMLENWCWIPDELSSISMHYSHLHPEFAREWKFEHGKKDLPPAKLPRETATKVAASRAVDLALSSLRQIVYAEFDMFAHGDREISEEELKQWWHVNQEDIGLIPGSKEMANHPGHGFATTVHFIEGSASNYYSYLFSQVYSSDIFHSAFKQNPRDSKVGERYRRLVLQPGGSQDPMEMIKAFLGRDSVQDAFLSDIGL